MRAAILIADCVLNIAAQALHSNISLPHFTPTMHRTISKISDRDGTLGLGVKSRILFAKKKANFTIRLEGHFLDLEVFKL